MGYEQWKEYGRFLSTLSLRRATNHQELPRKSDHISIHALLAESDALKIQIYGLFRISIHALLAESDNRAYSAAIIGALFLSTLSLRRATTYSSPQKGGGLFLSTLSLRRATVIASLTVLQSSISIHALLAESDGVVLGQQMDNTHFYPRSPCGERHQS